eukprot:snap_masked-scaffold_59-processed-gene-0.83-mRNA-1 protein AED:0.12 eAED:1.00 QI:0/-1/0/1/-1/1/1/0/232
MNNHNPKSSFAVFMSYVDPKSHDASAILSTPCYLAWKSTRKASLKQPEESFRRVLTAHVCGLIGRKPFPADVESSLLKELRKKQIWECFKDIEGITIGVKGFRKNGFHESRRDIFGKYAKSSLVETVVTRENSGIRLNSKLRKLEDRRHKVVVKEDGPTPLVGVGKEVRLNSHLSNDSANSVTPDKFHVDISVEVGQSRPREEQYEEIDPLHIFNQSQKKQKLEVYEGWSGF